MTTQQEDATTQDQRPPFFKSWKGIYAVVLIVFVILVALFYLFTIYFA